MAASKLTAAVTAAIATRLAAGAPLTDAARAEGIHPSTAKKWLATGRKDPQGHCGPFAEAVERARAAAAERPAAFTQEEFRDRLVEACRAGSVSALALWAKLYHADGDDEADDEPTSIIDRLAEQRKRARS